MKTAKYHYKWAERKQHILRSESCHPAWPNEKESIEEEMKRIRSVPSLAGKQKFWFFYEWLIFLLVLVIIITRVLSLTHKDNIHLFIMHKFMFGVGTLFSFLRMIKICIRFAYFSIFLKVASLAITSSIQIVLLYIQIYIPFTSAFFVIFGVITDSNNGTSSIRHGNVSTPEEGHAHSRFAIEHIFFVVWESSFEEKFIYQLETDDSVTKQILVSLFHVFSTFILFSLFIALCISQFTSNYKRCVAKASLLQASIVLQLEKGMNKRDKLKIEKFYNRHCNPMILGAKKFDDNFMEKMMLSKMNLTKRLVSDMSDRFHVINHRYEENCDEKKKTSLKESTVECISKLIDGKEVFCNMLQCELKYINKKQDFVNKHLSSLLSTDCNKLYN